jgi:uncharacterized membrane protein
MTAPNADLIIAGYWRRLETALTPVPAARRQELMDELRMHIAEARSRIQNESDADLLNILDRLGDPSDTAAAEIDRVDVTPLTAVNSRALEISAVILLLLFWPVGVILLWVSTVWTTRQKVIGTMVQPGGYFGVLIIGPLLAWGTVGVACTTVSDEAGRVLSTTCPSGGAQTLIDVGVAVLVVIYLVAPLVTALYLATRIRRAAARPTPADPSNSLQALVEA